MFFGLNGENDSLMDIIIWPIGPRCNLKLRPVNERRTAILFQNFSSQYKYLIISIDDDDSEIRSIKY